MGRLVTLCIVALALAACADKRIDHARAAKTSLVGLSKAELLSCAGAPDAADASNGLEVLTYNNTRVDTYPSPQFGFGYGFGHRHHGSSVLFGFPLGAYGDVRTRSCRASFSIREGRVAQVAFGGVDGDENARLIQCYHIVENCLALRPPQASTAAGRPPQ